jgi:hypothetical protein
MELREDRPGSKAGLGDMKMQDGKSWQRYGKGKREGGQEEESVRLF